MQLPSKFHKPHDFKLQWKLLVLFNTFTKPSNFPPHHNIYHFLLGTVYQNLQQPIPPSLSLSLSLLSVCKLAGLSFTPVHLDPGLPLHQSRPRARAYGDSFLSHNSSARRCGPRETERERERVRERERGAAHSFLASALAQARDPSSLIISLIGYMWVSLGRGRTGYLSSYNEADFTWILRILVE